MAAWDTRLGGIIHAGLETAGGDYLLPIPDTDGEGAQYTAQHQIGVVVGLLQGRNDSAAAPSDLAGMQEVRWELIQQLLALIMFVRQEMQEYL